MKSPANVGAASMLRMGLFCCACAVAIPSCAPSANVPMKERVRGDWWPVSYVNCGVRHDDSFKEEPVTFDSTGNILLQLLGKPFFGKCTFDERYRPIRLDLESGTASDKRKHFHGIAWCDGDTLKLCIELSESPSYPDAFESRPGDTTCLIVLRRKRQ